MNRTKIEWADAVWNPIVGCSKCSPGCRNCYAESFAHRLKGVGNPAYQDVVDERGWTGKLVLRKDELEKPLHWRKPRRVFVCSMGDLFHEEVPFESIDRVFAVMALASRHTFLLLTKRSRRMLEYLGWSSEKPDIIGRHDRGQKIDSSGHIGEYICGFTRCRWPIANVHTGVTVENGDYRYRIDDLRKTPAAVRFVSLEPMLGPMGDLNLDGIHWVIAGGESGPNARPAHPDWFRKVRDDCAAAGVPFFLKQVGPTKVAGRLLDGREHNELPGEAR